jgi:hypothetical protein
MMKMRNPVQVQDDEKDEDKDLEDLQSPTTKKPDEISRPASLLSPKGRVPLLQ